MRPGVLRGLAAAALVAWGGCVVGARPVVAQGRVAQRLAAAKQHLVDLRVDSAGLVLQAVLDTASGASAAERSWAFSLMALVRLEATDRSGAQTMFRQALRADGRLPLDSVGVLRELQSEAEGVLQETRRLYPPEGVVVAQPGTPRAPLAVRFEMPAETTLAASDGRLPIVLAPSRRARAVVTLARADAPGAILWRSDTSAAGATGPVFWPVRGGDGRAVAAGRYLFAVSVFDEANEQARAEWTVTVERAEADTQAVPEAVRPEELRPETVQVRRRAPAGLVLGAGLGAAAFMLPQLVGRTVVTSGTARDGTAAVAAGAAVVAGIVGFAGGRQAVAVPENVTFNAELRTQRASQVEEAQAANARAREQAPVRVRLERSGP